MINRTMSKFRVSGAPLIAFGAVILLTWLAYLPGLSGGFLFDDFVNLNAIGATGRVDNWSTFWRYVTSGTADPSGRPLALLSFLIDARDWPADPATFLRTNLILHVINGALLFALLRTLGRWLEPQPRSIGAVACLGAGLWLLHPLFVSTTLYIVQREAMLPATFTLLGLLAYVHGRDQYAQQGSYGIAIAWMISGIVMGTGLAVLCKANGLLLPLLALVLEATVLNQRVADQRLHRLRIALLVVPSIALVLYLASHLRLLHDVQGARPWTLAQRLLTEPRVLLDYLQLLAIPRSVSSGLYNDAYLASASLLQPWTTLPALLLVLGIPTLAFSLRKRFPALAAAVLFFFAGHLLESTVIPLELYFEHRNYLPAMLLFWPLARAIDAWQTAAWLRNTVATALLGLFALTTHQRALLWGQPEQLATLWARQNPESSRAQATIAMIRTKAGHPEAAVLLLEPLWLRQPYDLQLAFNYVDASCAWRGISPAVSHRMTAALQHARTGTQMINPWLGKAIDAAGSGRCPGLDLTTVERWLSAAQLNPAINNPHIYGQDVEPLLARLALRKQQPDTALLHFDQALHAFTTPSVAARQASLLASNGHYSQALLHLDYYERLKAQVRSPALGMPQLHSMVLELQGYWPNEMAALRSKLDAEIGSAAAREAQSAP